MDQLHVNDFFAKIKYTCVRTIFFFKVTHLSTTFRAKAGRVLSFGREMTRTPLVIASANYPPLSSLGKFGSGRRDSVGRESRSFDLTGQTLRVGEPAWVIRE